MQVPRFFGTNWCAIVVPIQVIRWYRQCYDGTDSCAIVVPIRRYSHYRLSYLQRCISFESYIKPQQSQYRACLWCVVYLLNPTSNHNKPALLDIITMLYIFWILHQTTTRGVQPMCPRCCISFESYIKPQPELRDRQAKHVVYLLNPTSNHNVRYQQSILIALYIFWLLHQTTTSRQTISNYIGCISFDSYIKPQLTEPFLCLFTVVYLLTPTSNHNIQSINNSLYLLYIFWLLHQTTTVALCSITMPSCISFDSYIKPQPLLGAGANGGGCISFDSYIKPQQSGSPIALSWSCISFDSYIKPQLVASFYGMSKRCISFDSYIKPQHRSRNP